MATQVKATKDDFLQMMLKKAYTKEEPATSDKTQPDPKKIEQMLKDIQAKKFK